MIMEKTQVKLGEISKFINGDRGKNYPSKDKLSKTGIPFISAINLDKGTVSTNNLLCVNEEQFKKLGSGKLEKNDIEGVIFTLTEEDEFVQEIVERSGYNMRSRNDEDELTVIIFP